MHSFAIFSERLRWQRNRTGLSQDELAHKSGVGKRSVVDYESERFGKQGPGMENVRKLAGALNVSSGWLLGGPEATAQKPAELRDPAPPYVESDMAMWRERALQAEKQLRMLQAAIQNLLDLSRAQAEPARVSADDASQIKGASQASAEAAFAGRDVATQILKRQSAGRRSRSGNAAATPSSSTGGPTGDK